MKRVAHGEPHFAIPYLLSGRIRPCVKQLSIRELKPFTRFAAMQGEDVDEAKRQGSSMGSRTTTFSNPSAASSKDSRRPRTEHSSPSWPGTSRRSFTRGVRADRCGSGRDRLTKILRRSLLSAYGHCLRENSHVVRRDRPEVELWARAGRGWTCGFEPSLTIPHREMGMGGARVLVNFN